MSIIVYFKNEMRTASDETQGKIQQVGTGERAAAAAALFSTLVCL
jgi:hypothetical protein